MLGSSAGSAVRFNVVSSLWRKLSLNSRTINRVISTSSLKFRRLFEIRMNLVKGSPFQASKNFRPISVRSPELGIVDGLSSRAIESEDDKQNRSKLLRDLGYKK